MEMIVAFNPVSHGRFWDMLGVVPPALQTGLGFLVGEPVSARECNVTGRFAPTFTALFELDGVYFEADRALTGREFRTVTPDMIRRNVGDA